MMETRGVRAMSRHWIVKKNHDRIWIVVYSVVGMIILMSVLMLAAISAAK